MNKVTRIRSAWRRHTFDVLLYCLLLVNRFTSRRGRVHWVGYKRRTWRLERLMFFLLFSGAMVLLEPHEYLLWSIALGSGLAFFLMAITFYKLTPRKRYHWIK